jgi:hypothetical protein
MEHAGNLYHFACYSSYFTDSGKFRDDVLDSFGRICLHGGSPRLPVDAELVLNRI